MCSIISHLADFLISLMWRIQTISVLLIPRGFGEERGVKPQEATVRGGSWVSLHSLLVNHFLFSVEPKALAPCSVHGMCCTVGITILYIDDMTLK